MELYDSRNPRNKMPRLFIGNSLFLVICVEERPWWSTQSHKKSQEGESERLRGKRDKIRFIDLQAVAHEMI